MNEAVAVALIDDRPIVEHRCMDGRLVTAILNSSDWTVIQAEPLTVEPSVSCDRCGLHGWIKDGRFWTTGGPR